MGKQYALWFANRGAAIVVNDLGGSMSGEGASGRAADIVVEEIVSKGLVLSEILMNSLLFTFENN